MLQPEKQKKVTDWLCSGLTTHQSLWVILCRFPEKRDRRDSKGDEREGQERKRNRNESEETGEIKTFPLYPYLRQVSTVSQYQLDALVT